ncbi:MAG TPA: tetratricopeptide repeat protein [Planctomycetota bacterium]|nr:tetratricopeptide repeat protein [Planctomycetota bacterium]
MRYTGPNERIRELLRRYGARFPVAEAALLVAQGEKPELEPRRWLDELRRHGEAVRGIVAGRGAEGRAAVDLLSAYVFRDLGFRGNREAYYDPRNSYLDEVIERRLGIPITLAIVYCEIGERAGLRPLPVGFPGHFLVKHNLPGGPVVLDPFDAGRVLSPNELSRLLEARYGLEVSYGPQLLRAAEPREVLARVLRNLKAIYLRSGDAGRAFRTVDQILIFEPDAREERRDRGLLAARLGRLDRALADLVRYARALPDNVERRTIRGEIDELRRKRAALN